MTKSAQAEWACLKIPEYLTNLINFMNLINFINLTNYFTI
jgi:hypothetical protein